MLGKLLKYEFKATARFFLPLYIALLVSTGINKLLFTAPISGSVLQSITKSISMILYVTILIGLIVMTFVIVIQRFYKNLLCDEGYLMFTLPVKAYSHIICKLLIASLWNIASAVIAIASILLMIDDGQYFLREIQEAFIEVITLLDGNALLVWFEVLVLGIISLASSILMIYAAIALGHLFSKYKVLASFGMFIALNTVSQIIGTVFMMVAGNVFFTVGANFNEFTFSHLQTVLFSGIAYSIIIAGGCYILTHYIMKNRLNLG